MRVAARVHYSRGCDRGGVVLQFGLVSCLVVAAVLGTQAMAGNFIGDLLYPAAQELESVYYAMFW